VQAIHSRVQPVWCRR